MLMRLRFDGRKLFPHEVLHGQALFGNVLLDGVGGLFQSLKLGSMSFLDQV